MLLIFIERGNPANPGEKILGRRFECICLNQDLQDFRIFRIGGDVFHFEDIHSVLS